MLVDKIAYPACVVFWINSVNGSKLNNRVAAELAEASQLPYTTWAVSLQSDVIATSYCSLTGVSYYVYTDTRVVSSSPSKLVASAVRSAVQYLLYDSNDSFCSAEGLSWIAVAGSPVLDNG